MSGRARKIAFGALAAMALIPLASADRQANLHINMERPGDAAPQRLEAAFHFGLVAVSVLVTWSKRLTT
ncbi:hypothetical protein P6144_15195 [Sphingomonas sp. HITSZ_GF]|uniref:hypothetical protein n=1 Tax=Sphingomonas sp. HITSZ_GF TaxID=3037247 RepID=UPI00240DCB6B|nr:hypothetical protein [Sphingomonas sp. HITSZ_GF]MDG2535004.1 hypothetical protein [Sphingomonas sp. HITSZ_GF]